MSHIWMSNGIHMNEAYLTHEWVASHLWMRQVKYTKRGKQSRTSRDINTIHMKESCHAYEWVVSHTWMSRVTCTNVSFHTDEWSCHTYDRIISRMKGVLTRCIKHVISTSQMYFIRILRINKPRHTWKWVKSHVWIIHVACVGESCRTYEWVMSHIPKILTGHVTHTKNTYEQYLYIYSYRKIFTRNTKHVVSASHIWMVRVTHMNEK